MQSTTIPSSAVAPQAAFSPGALSAYLPALLPGSPVTFWVGFSGGLDSRVLLHALAQLALPVRLCAIHVNHQLSPNADQWQAQCAQVAAELGVEFIAEKVQVISSGRGLEDAARRARYEVFERHLKPGDYLLTGHHANDQAETLLLRLMRGTGLRGLAAMAAKRDLAQGYLQRPLLAFSRAQLEIYARAQQLIWVDDESNQDDYYDRNFLRNQVLPLLAQRWPGFMHRWQQTAERCAEQEGLLAAIAQEDLAANAPRQERVGTSIDLLALRGLSPVRQQNLLRYWLRQAGYSTPEQSHWQQIQQQLLAGRQDAEANVTWAEVSLRVFRARLYLLPNPLPALTLAFVPKSGDALDLDGPCLRADLPELRIHRRLGGERCKPQGRQHSQVLKKLLQEYELEPWLREDLPLVYSAAELVAVGDLWVCAGYVAEAGEAGYCLRWYSR